MGKQLLSYHSPVPIQMSTKSVMDILGFHLIVCPVTFLIFILRSVNILRPQK